MSRPDERHAADRTIKTFELQDGSIVEVGQAVQLVPGPGEQQGRVMRVLHLYEQASAGPRRAMHADGSLYEWPLVRSLCCRLLMALQNLPVGLGVLR